MGSGLSSLPPNPRDTASATMASSQTRLPPKQEDPDSLKTLEDPQNPTVDQQEQAASDPQNPIVQPREEAASDPPPTAESSISTEKDQDSSTVKEGEEGEEEDEEEGECGFCLFMKAGGCRDSFTSWEKCIEEAEKNGEDIVDKCAGITGALKKCMEAHEDYYAPILRAEKAAEEEAVRELEKEKERESASGKNNDLEKEKEEESASGKNNDLEKEKEEESASGLEAAKMEAS